MSDDFSPLQEKVAHLAAKSVIREAQRSSLMRQHFDGSEFARLYRDLKSVFGDGVRITYFTCPAGEYGRPHAPGVPFSDPPPVALKRGRR